MASRISLVLAVACGLAAFVLTRGYAQRLEAERPALGPLQPVVVAAADIPRGTTLSAAVLREGSLPGRYSPPGALTDVSAAAGRVAVADLAEGEPITRTRVAAAGVGPLAALVPPGLRAFAIGTGAPPGELRPGDRVDVLATFGGGRPHTETVGTALEVLRVIDPGSGSALDPAASGDGPQLVLLVSPDEAEQLAYAAAFAHLSVSIEPPPTG